MDLRRVIRDRMDELGMTQARLSELTGSTRPRICTFLSGKRGVNTETLENWLKVLKLEIRTRPKRRRPKGR